MEIEAHRIEQRTKFDLEMLTEVGSCKGVENYSRHFDGREKMKEHIVYLISSPHVQNNSMEVLRNI